MIFALATLAVAQIEAPSLRRHPVLGRVGGARSGELARTIQLNSRIIGDPERSSRRF